MKINHDVIRKSSVTRTLKRWKRQRNLLGYFWNRFEWHFYPRFSLVRKYPIHMDFELTSRCQLKCPMCFRQHRNVDKQDDMQLKMFKNIINEISGKVYSIKFTGRGEPLMNKNFSSFMNILKEKNFGEVGIITNGLLMTQDLMHDIIDSGIDVVSFSIDGLKNEYETIRAPGKYEDIFSIVSRLKRLREQKGKHKPLIRIQSVKMKPEEENAYLDIWKPVSDDILFLYFKDYASEAQYTQMTDYTCPLPFQRMMVHFDGTVPMCINDEYEANIMGNIKNETVMSVWQGKRFKEARSIQKQGIRIEKYENCKSCALTRQGHGK